MKRYKHKLTDKIVSDEESPYCIIHDSGYHEHIPHWVVENSCDWEDISYLPTHIKVIKASKATYWYAKHIGEVFPVNGYVEGRGYATTLGDFYVQKNDCVAKTLSSEEEKKPEYTILSFSAKENFQKGNILTIKEIEKHRKRHPGLFTLESYLAKDSLWNIHSVRRESDGEVFTIGDVVFINSFGKLVIDSFLIFNNKMLFISGIENYKLEDICKEVKPKEWEITGFINNNKGYPIIRKNAKEKWQGKCEIYDNIIEEGKTHKIYSVKRLGDGVEFKIGDKVKCWDGMKTIEIIYILNSNDLRFGMVNQNIDSKNSKNAPSGYTLNYIQKVEKLFTTEDGVDIYDGAWLVNPKNLDIGYAVNTNAKYLHDTYKHLKWFSTKKAAEEYIFNSGICLSLNDVEKFFDASTTSQYSFNCLKELVKSKLNSH